MKVIKYLNGNKWQKIKAYLKLEIKTHLTLVSVTIKAMERQWTNEGLIQFLSPYRWVLRLPCGECVAQGSNAASHPEEGALGEGEGGAGKPSPGGIREQDHLCSGR